MSKSPLADVKAKFGEKSKLVEAVEKFTNEDLWVARTNKSKGLAHVSNAKLLRLHAIFAEVKEKFGTREKLIAAILELTKRQGDDGYKAGLGKFPVPRLYDLYKSTNKRVNPAPAKPAVKKAPVDKAAKQPAKTAAAKKKSAAAPKKSAAKAKKK